MPTFNKDEYVPMPKLTEGDYPFTVLNAESKVSQNGNDMINLELAIETPERIIKVYDRLVFTSKALGFIKGFCDATGLDQQWETGVLEPEHCIGAEGMVHLELGDKKEDGKQFMEVGYYLKKGQKPKFSEQPKKQVETKMETVPTGEEDLPF